MYLDDFVQNNLRLLYIMSFPPPDETYPLTTPIQYIRTAEFFCCYISEMTLNKSATIRVCLFTKIWELVDTKTYELTGEDYNLWNSDDYIIEYVKNQLAQEPHVGQLRSDNEVIG
jgi:hypothetical protein